MSAARPKLVQEGSPLMQDGNYDNQLHHPQRLRGSSLSEHVPPGTSSLLLSSKVNHHTAPGKSKFRMVIGGETDDAELPDDPDQYHYSVKQGYNNIGTNHRGGRGDNGRGFNRLTDYHHPGGRGRGRGRGAHYEYNDYSHDGGYDRHLHTHSNNTRTYYDNHHYVHDVGGVTHNTSLKRVVKNPKSQGLVQSRFVIGGDSNGTAVDDASNEPTVSNHQMEIDDGALHPTTDEDFQNLAERMEGVISLDAKEPLVVMDGANVAYAYADALASTGTTNNKNNKPEPDCRGLQVAANYFLQSGIRVLIVLPAPWFRLKPRAGDTSSDNALMLTEKLEVLSDLKARGLLVAAPPRDDDDAYALTIARREHYRFRHVDANGVSGSGHVLSNDMFRDAMARDADLETWLQQGGRISYAFCDLGTMNDHGEKELDFIPNPRHFLVSEIERQKHAASASS